jgi:primosomal protein N' (replication factor Y)
MPVELNPLQQKAYDKIRSDFQKKDVALLHGVTSSGKTEIYIHFIREALDRGQQVLYLLPEIALTAQMINRLQHVFGSKVAVYHSKYSDSDRRMVWEHLLHEDKEEKGQIRIVLGARSSVFLPFRSLGLVIVDEEHENTYKQHDPAPRYHARDTAVVLAGFHGAKVLLGTATPSLETYHNCMTGKYALAELHERYLDIRMPEIQVVNTREARRRKSMHGHFSDALLQSIGKTLQEGEQVILFQNRRGFSTYIECENCGWVPFCNRCDVSLTHHKHRGRMKCHYCGHSESLPPVCLVCGSEHLSMKGFGTEKIEEEVAMFFPDARIGRLDLDAVRSRATYEKLLAQFELQELDVLVGTQMVSKGLDFDHVRLVGIMSADSMLNYPDFRSYERSYQLMAQVSGRAGRKGKQGIVVIQTTDEQHPVIGAVVENDYQTLYKNQTEERQKFGYPPFTRLAEITLKHRDREVLDGAAGRLAAGLKHLLGKRVIGPEYPLISRIRNLYLKRTLIKMEKGSQLAGTKKAVATEISNLLREAAYKTIQVTVNVDPY